LQIKFSTFAVLTQWLFQRIETVGRFAYRTPLLLFFFLSGQGDVVVSLVLITQVAAMKLTTEEDVSLNID